MNTDKRAYKTGFPVRLPVPVALCALCGEKISHAPQRHYQLIHLRSQRLIIREGRGIVRDRVEGAYPVRVHARAGNRTGELGIAHFAVVAVRAINAVGPARDAEEKAHIRPVKRDRDRRRVTRIEGARAIDESSGKGRPLGSGRALSAVVAIDAVVPRHTLSTVIAVGAGCPRWTRRSVAAVIPCRALTAIGSARQAEGEVQGRPAQRDPDRRGIAGIAGGDAVDLGRDDTAARLDEIDDTRELRTEVVAVDELPVLGPVGIVGHGSFKFKVPSSKFRVD